MQTKTFTTLIAVGPACGDRCLQIRCDSNSVQAQFTKSKLPVKDRHRHPIPALFVKTQIFRLCYTTALLSTSPMLTFPLVRLSPFPSTNLCRRFPQYTDAYPQSRMMKNQGSSGPLPPFSWAEREASFVTGVKPRWRDFSLCLHASAKPRCHQN